jgi:hypothetical protein
MVGVCAETATALRTNMTKWTTINVETHVLARQRDIVALDGATLFTVLSTQ